MPNTSLQGAGVEADFYCWQDGVWGASAEAFDLIGDVSNWIVVKCHFLYARSFDAGRFHAMFSDYQLANIYKQDGVRCSMDIGVWNRHWHSLACWYERMIQLVGHSNISLLGTSSRSKYLWNFRTLKSVVPWLFSANILELWCFKKS